LILPAKASNFCLCFSFYRKLNFLHSALKKKIKPMKIHEYQGKELLKNYGVPVPRGIVARTPEEAEQAARDLGTSVVVVKAQIHAGGRGKGGGVKLAKSPEEARTIAEQMLGMMLVTHQTGAEGREVKTLAHRRRLAD
jgi:succinyl-CoA synthetase beta subunit